MTELFVVAENGQVEVNWESLELITNDRFVDRIKNQQKSGLRVVDIKDYDYTVRVNMSDSRGVVGVYEFHKGADPFITYHCFNKYDVAEWVKILGGEVKWNRN